MKRAGVSHRFKAIQPSELIKEVRMVFSDYPSIHHSLDDIDKINYYIKTAINDFNQHTYEPVVIEFSELQSREIPLKGMGINQILEVSQSTGILNSIGFDGTFPLGFGMTSGSIIGYGAIDRLQTYLSNRGRTAQTLKDIKGHLKFDFDEVTETLHLRDSSDGVRIIFIPDYSLDLKVWYIADYQANLFTEIAVQRLVLANADIMSKAQWVGATTNINPTEERQKYNDLLDRLVKMSSPPFIGRID